MDVRFFLLVLVGFIAQIIDGSLILFLQARTLYQIWF
jgi:hypothetical protein